MLKTASALLLILIIVNPSTIGISKSLFTDKKDNFIFSPIDMVLKDDAFHGAKTSHYTEWWYFDAVFDNNYSAQMNVRMLGVLNHGIVFKRLDLYKDGALISHNKKSYPMRDFSASKEVPMVYLDDLCVINGSIDKSTGNWTYDISFEFDDASALLKFTGCTDGWRGRLHGNEWWGVALPRAKTSGTLTINDEIINVTGFGYHDHNWNITASAVANFGWYWGKIHSSKYTLTWATIMRTRLNEEPLLVINKNQGGYLNIEPTEIEFTANDFSFENRHLIPHSFTIIVNKDNVSINVKMDVIDIHHDRSFGFINYWRYHFKCKGSITVDSQTEIIDSYQVAEFLRFR